MKHLFTLLIAFALLLNSCSPKEEPRPMPKASFTWTNAGEGVVQFTSQSTEADNYEWSFGDGATATTSSPKHSYATNGMYKVALMVKNPTGTDQITQEIQLSSYTSPVASFSVSYGEEGLVSFTNTSSNATAFRWDLGNGTTSDLASLSFKYPENKKYTITLTATGKGGQTKSSKEIEVVNAKPVADFSWNESNGQVSFINRTKNADSYSWDFGNGKTSIEPNPTTQYSKAGDYTIKLTAKGKGGESVKQSFINISFTNSVLAGAVDDPKLVSYLPGTWASYVAGKGYKYYNYVYTFALSSNAMQYKSVTNTYETLIDSKTTNLAYKFSIANNIIYTDDYSGKKQKYARIQIVSEDQMKLFQIFESASSYSELFPITLTKTNDVEMSASSVIASSSVLSILNGIWDQGNYSIYSDVSFDFSSGKNHYRYSTTYNEAKSIQKREFRIDSDNMFSCREWNSDFRPEWEKYKIEVVSPSQINLYSISSAGVVSKTPTYTMNKR
ncbi:PKD domain-containing protein [Spirosoma oryzicola]|uniref:PKD domain-containing protein n=1 Tax=Spirosoma oryzicola TaxID=2898794 RepID=UPI00244A9141|nr:PKD domain-containing protein [Spirosoma oryzicola]